MDDEMEELDAVKQETLDEDAVSSNVETDLPPEIKEEIKDEEPDPQPGPSVEDPSRTATPDHTVLDLSRSPSTLRTGAMSPSDVSFVKVMEPEMDFSLTASVKQTTKERPIKGPPAYYSNYFLPVQKQPLPHQHVKILGKEIPSPEVMCNPMITGKGIRPSTVKVRWMLNIRNTVYNAEHIYAYLIRYGPIENMYQASPNSVVVVFSHIESALAAVKDPKIGFPWDPLIITWVDPRMNNFGNVQKHASMADVIIQMNMKE